jgi:protein O-GlcNAc transferase
MNEILAAAFEYYQRGDLEQAEVICKKILATDPDIPDVLFLLGVLYYQRAQYDLAIDHFRKADILNPESSDILYNLANAYRKAGQYDEAISCYSNVIQLNPDFYEAYHNLGIARMEIRQIDEAIGSFQEALRLNPDSYNSFYYLGILFLGKGQIDKSIDCLQKTVQMNPDDDEAWYKLGNAFQEKGELEEALQCFQKAVRINPHFIDAYNDMGILLTETGKDEEAAAVLDEALGLKPESFRAHLAKCISRLRIIYPDRQRIPLSRKEYHDELCSLKESIPFSDQEYIKAAAESIGMVHPFYLAYQGLNDRDLQMTYGELVCKVMGSRYPQWAQSLPMPPAIHYEPLRIGIVSRFFYRHSVWKIPMKGWIENLDRERFSLYGYYTGRKKDEETAIARSYFVNFVEDVCSLEQLCKTIRRDNLHMLIYPEIGMDETTVKLAALKLAPIQCASWGHPDTSGFPTIDYFLSSELMEPPDADGHYTETLIRLPNLSFSYSPPEPSKVFLNRESLGVPAEATLYLCCQSLFKYLPQYDEVFPRIAKNAGQCRFLFISHSSRHVTEQFRQRIRQIFETYHMNADDYLLFLPRLDASQYHGINRIADVYLDSIGWSGCNTTLEAIACNLPVVTLPGKLMRGVHSTAMLRMMGLGDTIAESLDHYVMIATKLGNDLPYRRYVSEMTASNKQHIYNDMTCIAALEDFFKKSITGRR